MRETRNILAETMRIIIPLLILAAGIGGFLVFGQRPEVPQRDLSDDLATVVETYQVKPFQEKFSVEIEGVAVPYRSVTLSAEVAGRITHKGTMSRAGSYVDADDLLFRIDETDYALEVERLASQFNQANEEVAAVDVDSANTRALILLAKEEVALRMKELSRREKLADRNAVTDSAIDEARRLELNARNSLQNLSNQLASLVQRKKTLEAARDLVSVQQRRAEVDQQRTRIASPLKGTVIADYVEIGDYIKKGDPLIRIKETGRMEVKCNLRVDELYWIWMQSGVFGAEEQSIPNQLYELPPTPVTIHFEFKGVEYMWDGVLSRYEGTGVDASTRTVPCRVFVENPSDVKSKQSAESGKSFLLPSLISGMYVTIRIPIETPVSLLELPSSAVRPGGRVWIVRNGKLEIETVEVARKQDDRVLVKQTAGGGLQPQDQVVTSPLSNAVHGMRVKEAVQ